MVLWLALCSSAAPGLVQDLQAMNVPELAVSVSHSLLVVVDLERGT